LALGALGGGAGYYFQDDIQKVSYKKWNTNITRPADCLYYWMDLVEYLGAGMVLGSSGCMVFTGKLVAGKQTRNRKKIL
jgi:hypothetical protein